MGTLDQDKQVNDFSPLTHVIQALGFQPVVKATKSAPQTLVPDVYNLMLADMSEAERAAFEHTYARVFAATGDAVKAMLAGQGAINRLYKGLAVKAARKADNSVIVAGWGVLFGDPQHRDVDKTWFGPNTNYFLEDYATAPLWLQHGADVQVGSLKAGNRIHAELFPEVGVWAEHAIAPDAPAFEAADFNQTVKDIENGLYTYSSDSILHHVQNGYNPGNGELQIWPIAGWSLIKPDAAKGLPPAAEPGLGPVVIKREGEAV